jgi:putative intracellular protease/amidase
MLASPEQTLCLTASQELGAVYSAPSTWRPYAVVDGNLITGQNPASSADVAEQVVKALSVRALGSDT